MKVRYHILFFFMIVLLSFYVTIVSYYDLLRIILGTSESSGLCCTNLQEIELKGAGKTGLIIGGVKFFNAPMSDMIGDVSIIELRVDIDDTSFLEELPSDFNSNDILTSYEIDEP